MESPHFLISDYIKKLDDTDNFRKILYKKGIMSKIFPEENLLLIYTKFENSNSIQTDLKNECRSLIIDTEEKKIVSYTCNTPICNLEAMNYLLGHNELSIKAKDGVLSLSILENQNSTSNTFSIDIDGEFKEDAVFNFVINISNIKILPGDYDVEISSKLITQFKHKGLNVVYWIALEKSSTYGA